MIHWLGNATTLGQPKWYPEPQQRGTFSVLVSCLTTLFLCTWTAVHLKVPRHGYEHRQIWYRIGWMITGLLAPEYMLLNAMQQRFYVKQMTRDMRRAHRKAHRAMVTSTKSTGNSLSAKGWRQCWFTRLLRFDRGGANFSEDVKFWDDEHSWLVCAGGIVIDIGAANAFLPEGATRLTLTREGLLFLYTQIPELLPMLTSTDIQNKSRADSLTKLLTCLQALWFCVQCVTRLSYGLPIALLELNVFGHAFCCLLTYGVWWQKPKDIVDPFRITSPDAHILAAWMSNYSKLGSQNVATQGSGGQLKAYYWHPAPITDGSAFPDATADSFVATTEILDHGLFVHGKPWSLRSRNGEQMLATDLAEQVSIDQYTVRRLTLVGKAPLQWTPPTKVKKYVRWSAEAAPHDRNDLVSWGSFVAGILYGALHLVAWNAAFPRLWQQTLWRTACITVMASGPVIYAGYEGLDWLDRGPDHALANSWAWLSIVAIVALFYTFCRGYIIVECFINLAYLQPNMLELPNWSLYVPHIT